MASQDAWSSTAPSVLRRFDLAPFVEPGLEQLAVKSKTDYRKMVNLSSNESDLVGLRTLVRRYLDQVPETLATRYPGWPAMIRETAEFYGLQPSNLCMAAGSDSAIQMIMCLLGRTCRHVVLQSPNYPNYGHYATLAGCVVTEMHHPDDRWGVELADTAARILANSPPALVIVTNPNGITGTLVPLAEMERLCDTCAQGNHLLLVDEAYAPFVSMPHRTLLERYRGAMTVRSFSKSCGMAGLRLGLVVADEAVASYLKPWNSVNSVCGLSAGYLSFCYTHANEVEAQNSVLDITRARFAADVVRLFPSWRSLPSAANFLLFDTGSANLADALAGHLANRRILIRRFIDGPTGLRACLRITIGDNDVMASLLAEMSSFASASAFMR